VAVAAIAASTTVATSCRDPVVMVAPCGGSLAAAAFAVARGALDERRLVGTDASDLNASAGVRAGTVGTTLRTQRQEIGLQPLETRTFRGTTTYLEVEKPRFQFLEGSMGAVVAAVVATTALPDASAARASSSVDRPAVGASAPTPDARSSTASAALGDRGALSHHSGGLAPRRFLLLLLLPLPTTSTPRSPGEKVPAARAAGTPHPAVPSAPTAESSSPSCAPPALAPAVAPRARPLGLGAWAGLTAQHLRSPSTKNNCQNRAGTL
jgi:hypothetical protein